MYKSVIIKLEANQYMSDDSNIESRGESLRQKAFKKTINKLEN